MYVCVLLVRAAEGGAVLSGGSGRVLTMEEEVFGLVVKLSNYVTRKEAQVRTPPHPGRHQQTEAGVSRWSMSALVS